MHSPSALRRPARAVLVLVVGVSTLLLATALPGRAAAPPPPRPVRPAAVTPHVAVECATVVGPTASGPATEVAARIPHCGGPSGPPGPLTNLLYGVSCPTVTWCVAVGSYDTRQGVQTTLAETWDGTRWSVVPTPSPGSVLSILTGVACTSPSDCVAVGDTSSSTDQVSTLAEVWDGATWSVVHSPDPDVENVLSGVSCTSPTACTAVGWFAGQVGPTFPLVESWNGAVWSVVTSPVFGSGSMLAGVSCSGPTDCRAVGSFQTVSGVQQTLVESWNGSTWVVVASPSPGTGDSLDGVSCTGPDNCMAVGSYTAPLGYQQTLVEIWNGSTWSVTPSQDPGVVTDVLESVSCTAVTDCVAVGSYYASTGQKTLVETWIGIGGAHPSSPNPGEDSWLAGVSCTSATHCTAVGVHSGPPTANRPWWRAGTDPPGPWSGART